MDLTGYLTINETDVWTEYSAFLGETEAGGHVNMDALLRMPKAKDITTVDFRERNGVELPQNPDVKLSSIERTLQFWLRGSSADDRLEKYQRMMTLITSISGYAIRTGLVRELRRRPVLCAVLRKVSGAAAIRLGID